MTKKMGKGKLIIAIYFLMLAKIIFAEPFAYVVNSDSDNNADNLYKIDLATGASELIGATGFADVEGLAWMPDGRLFGVDDATDTLLLFDVSTGAGQPVGNQINNLGLSGAQDYGLTATCEGELLLVSDVTKELYKVNPESGQLKLIGDIGNPNIPITALAANKAGVFGVGIDGFENLYKIDPNNGNAVLIGSLGNNIKFSDAGLAFDEAGKLWAVADQTGADGFLPSLLFNINLATGEAEGIKTTIVGVEALAISPLGPCSMESPVLVGAHAVPIFSELSMTIFIILVLIIGSHYLLTKTSRFF